MTVARETSPVLDATTDTSLRASGAVADGAYKVVEDAEDWSSCLGSSRGSIRNDCGPRCNGVSGTSWAGTTVATDTEREEGRTWPLGVGEFDGLERNGDGELTDRLEVGCITALRRHEGRNFWPGSCAMRSTCSGQSRKVTRMRDTNINNRGHRHVVLIDNGPRG
jgi:hypothetical protein